MNKKDEIFVLAESKGADIICVTETQLCSDILDAEVSLPNFQLFREDRRGNIYI